MKGDRGKRDWGTGGVLLRGLAGGLGRRNLEGLEPEKRAKGEGKQLLDDRVQKGHGPEGF